MTATEFLKEICLRAGEGYREYTDRAKSYAKSVMIEMARQLPDIDVQAPAMVANKTMTISGNQMFIPYDDLADGVAGDIIRIISLLYNTALPEKRLVIDGDSGITYTAKPDTKEKNIYVGHVLHPYAGWNPDIVIVKNKGLPDDVTIQVRLENNDGVDPITTYAEIEDLVNNSAAQLYISATVGDTPENMAREMPATILSGGDAEQYQAERISQAEFDAYLLRPDLLRRKGNFNFYTVADGKLWLVRDPSRGATVIAKAVIWQDAFITPVIQDQVDKNNLAEKFSAGFIQRTIDIASERMRAEIQA